MAQRPALRFAAVILGGMVFLFLAVGTAEFIAVPGPPAVVTFEQAEFVPNSARRPPGDDAAWKTVRLPDEWRKRPAFGGHGWYRIKLDLHRAPEGLQAVFIRNRRSDRITFFVNGKLIGSAREVMSLSAGRAERGFEAPLGFAVPPSMLRPGQNMIHIRMEGSSDPASINGLSRIFYGDARTLRRAQLGINEFNFQARRHTISMALAAGIVTLFLWFARRADRVMFWFCMTCLSWGAVGFLYIKVRWVAPVEITSVMSFYASYGLVVPTLVLSLRTVDLKWPRFEAALWLFFLFELSYPLWPGRPWPAAYLFWSGANTGLLLAAAGIVFYGARRPLEWPIKLQLAALTAMAAFMSFEIARFFGWVDVESPLMRHYHVPIMLFALGAVCFERHARAIRKTAQLNIELEQRVAEKAREIEANHARIGDALRERTLARERQRILADMHDGMGATLVSLLRHVQSGVADPGSIGRRARDALREMRAAIDALQPHGGDLAAVLANLRERLDGLMAGSGVRLVWEVDELPLALALTPFAVFSLQRIVLEAVGNALKHSESSEIHFIVRTRDDGDVEIRIADNGRGFDPARVHAGLGLANMRARAERIGVGLDIISRTGEGTVVQVTVPPGAQQITPAAAQADPQPGANAPSTPAARIATVALFAAISLMAGYAPRIEAASPPRVIEFVRADFVQSAELRPPDDAALWERLVLPDQWRSRPGLAGPGWYRMRFNLDRVPRGMQSVLVRHRRAYRISFFVNGKLIGAARDMQSMAGGRLGRGMGTVVFLSIPPSLLRTGENVIHARMEASSHPARVDGLGRVVLGATRPLRQLSQWASETGFSTKRDVIFMTLAAGLIAFFLWLARRSDRVMLWFSAACLSWGVMGLAYLMWRWSDLTMVSNFLYFYQVYGLVAPVVILSLRTVGLTWPRLETALWLFFAVELTYPLWGSSWPFMHVVWDAANTLFLLAAAGIMFRAAPRPMKVPIRIQLVALTTMSAVIFFEIARYLGWVDVESPVIRHFHVPVMLIAMGAACFERYARATREAERTTAELEHRVMEKVSEIEANRARVDEARRERALSQERQRILADMHDGLGASLVNLLRYVDSGRTEMAIVERRVQEALQEMRAAIDALQPHGGDLAAVLGSLRERLDGLVAGSNVRLVWQVDELPPVQELKPSAVFTLQRIVLGAVDNALKHSCAKEIRFKAFARDDGDVEMRIEDNGQGFDLEQARDGPGLSNMRARAERIGAGFEIASRPGRGTVVRLTLPRALPTRSAEGAEPETESVPMPRLVPAAQIV